MGWIIVILALTVVMTVLTAAEFWLSIKANTLRVSHLIGDRVIGVFAIITFAIAFVQALGLLAGQVLH